MHFWFFSSASRLSRHVSAAVCLSRLAQTDGTVCPVCQIQTGQADWPFSLSRLPRHVLGRPPMTQPHAGHIKLAHSLHKPKRAIFSPSQVSCCRYNCRFVLIIKALSLLRTDKFTILSVPRTLFTFHFRFRFLLHPVSFQRAISSQQFTASLLTYQWMNVKAS